MPFSFFIMNLNFSSAYLKILSVLYPLMAEALPCIQDDRLSANSTTCRPCLFQNVTCFLYLKCQERHSPRIPKISHYYNIYIKPCMFQKHQSKTSVLQLYSRKGSRLLERKGERDTRGEPRSLSERITEAV